MKLSDLGLSILIIVVSVSIIVGGSNYYIEQTENPVEEINMEMIEQEPVINFDLIPATT